MTPKSDDIVADAWTLLGESAVEVVTKEVGMRRQQKVWLLAGCALIGTQVGTALIILGFADIFPLWMAVLGLGLNVAAAQAVKRLIDVVKIDMAYRFLVVAAKRRRRL